MSATVNKALSLLDMFTEASPEIGLSDIGRLAGIDKATTHRLLKSLSSFNLLEQHPDTKLYRLGSGVLHLARIREATFPMLTAIQPALDHLASETGETAHASLHRNNAMSVIAVVESRKANRVSLAAGDVLPFHATASGMAYLAFAPPTVVKKALSGPIKTYAKQTCIDKTALLKMVELARQCGYATVENSFEDEVCGISAPFFGTGAAVMGAIAVATPSHRMSSGLRAVIIRSIMKTASEVSRKLGGVEMKKDNTR